MVGTAGSAVVVVVVVVVGPGTGAIVVGATVVTGATVLVVPVVTITTVKAVGTAGVEVGGVVAIGDGPGATAVVVVVVVTTGTGGSHGPHRSSTPLRGGSTGTGAVEVVVDDGVPGAATTGSGRQRRAMRSISASA